MLHTRTLMADLIKGEDVKGVELNRIEHDFRDDKALNKANAAQTSINSLDVRVHEEINEIIELIPQQATSENKLADKDFVNSTVATNTSNFIGTFTSLEELESQAATNNDYAFWQTTDTSGNVLYKRYKYVSDDSSWQYEYDLNNSSFTEEQWKSINSGITAEILSELMRIAQQTVTLDRVYPVGSIYMSVNDVDPELLFGGTWEKLEGRFLLGTSEDYELGAEDGEAEHTLSTEEMPNHTHTLAHTHTMSHSHDIAHMHTISHTHNMNHYHDFANAYYAPTGTGAPNLNATGSRTSLVFTTPTYSTTRAYVYGSYPARMMTDTGGASTSWSSAKIYNSSGTEITSSGGSSSENTGPASTTTTSSAGGKTEGTITTILPHNNMPPYLAVNMWKRTA